MPPKEVLSKAPARVCLFGDHQDYLSLPIIACAIDRFVEIKGIQNSSREFHFDFIDLNTSRTISIDDLFESLKKEDHIAAVLRVLRRYDCVPTVGYDIQVKGNIPINAGLSSSSAVVVAWIRFLLKAFGSSHQITNELIAQMAHEAEVLEHNSPGGKMDHYSIAIGDIIYMNTDASNKLIKIPKTLKGLIVAESGTPKDTVGMLADRKNKGLKSIQLVQEVYPNFDVQKAALSEIDKYLTILPKELQPVFIAAVQNYQITQEALLSLNSEALDYKRIGDLMNRHHEVLRDLLKITTPKIDTMINAALNAGAYGAKIVGSGGGGSICAIAPEEKQEDVIQVIRNVSKHKAYLVNVSSVNLENND